MLAESGAAPVPPHLRPAAKTYRHPADSPEPPLTYRPKAFDAGFLGERTEFDDPQ
jgi:hypothetical protein